MLICYFNNTTKGILVSRFFVDFNKVFLYFSFMEKKVFFNTTVPESLIKEFKILAIQLSKRQNQLLEEAIKDILKKYQEMGEE